MADVLPAPTSTDPDVVSARPRAVLPVLEGGLVTTVLTVGLLFWLAHAEVDFNPMGLYANYVIPAGAILVGLVAGSGYGVMSYLTGVKIRRGLLVGVIAMQIVAYFAAEYASYLDVVHQAQAAAEKDGDRFEPAPFLSYFHYKAENFAWKKKDSNDSGEPLGHAGYFFVLLAAAGFVGGGLIAPLVCMARPYCDGCQRYMKTKPLGLIPASVPARKVKKKDADGQAAYAAEQDAASTAGDAHATQISAAAGAGDVGAFDAATAAAFGPKKATAKLPVRLETDLVHCAGCGRGWLNVTAVAGQGNQVKRQRVSQTEVARPFTDAVLNTKPGAGAA